MSATAAKPIPYDALSYLRANAAVRGDALAVHDEGEELSFEALHRAVLSLAARPARARRRPGRRRRRRAPERVALRRARDRRARHRRHAAAAAGQPRAARDRGRDRALGAKLVIGEDDELDTDGEPDDGPFAEPDPDRVVQIALTSGTTGRSKLASLTARLKQLTFEGFTSRLQLGPRTACCRSRRSRRARGRCACTRCAPARR
jgi:hypothetical protein